MSRPRGARAAAATLPVLLILALLLALVPGLTGASTALASPPRCVSLTAPTCGTVAQAQAGTSGAVGSGRGSTALRRAQPASAQPDSVTPDPQDGVFRGLIAVHGEPWLFEKAGSAGTEAGCGDCVWTIVIACPTAKPGGVAPPACLGAVNSPACQPGQVLFRVYLTTEAFVDRITGTLCLGGEQHVLPVTELVDGDIERYLRDVTPPDLVVTTRPATATLAGLPTYFAARPPPGLHPVPFGGPDVTETITIDPRQADWEWSDGDGSGWLPLRSTATHSFVAGGPGLTEVSTRWGATYTVTVDSMTLGPYTADGQLTRTQTFALPVRTSSPHLVSQ